MTWIILSAVASTTISFGLGYLLCYKIETTKYNHDIRFWRNKTIHMNEYLNALDYSDPYIETILRQLPEDLRHAKYRH